jgi:hypothetical protein
LLRDIQAVRLAGGDFKNICESVSGAGYRIQLSPAFEALHIADLIANTLKHGEGQSFKRLTALRPDLFRGPFGAYEGEPLPELLFLDQPEFDKAVAATAAHLAELVMLWRVAAESANLLAVNVNRIAVDDPR